MTEAIGAANAVAASDGAPPVIEARHLSKRYGPIRALDNVSLQIHASEIVGLVGDNGAGKSTLINVLSGAIQPSSGTIMLGGVPVHFHSALDARDAGIETVYQDLALAPDLSVWQNLFLGREKTVRGPLGALGWLDRRSMVKEADTDIQRTRIRIGTVSQECGMLSGGQRQAVAVTRTMVWGSKVALLDEPTAALGVEQQDQVAELLRNLRSQGLAILLITHNIPQAMEICDRILVMFRGALVANLQVGETTTEELVTWITGKKVTYGD